MNRKVIYTCITGGYDKLMQPLVVDESFDYICFTDILVNKSDGVWQFREIPSMDIDSQKLSRYPKMHPHLLLQEYEYSIYVDANILIQQVSFYESINSCIESDIKLAGIKHPKMNCLYEEFFNVYKQRKELNIFELRKQYKAVKSTGFPCNFGMYEANIIFRKHKDPQVISQCEDWWSMFVKFTKRDQLSYSYTLWKNNLKFRYIMKGCTLHSTEEEPYGIISHPKRSVQCSNVFFNKLFFKIIPDRYSRQLFYAIMNI